MAFDGNGTFNRLYSWVTDKINGINITAARVDAEDTGFAAGLSLCVTRDGQGKMTTDFLPGSDNTLNLGSSGQRWASINGIPITAVVNTSGSFTMTGVGFAGTAPTGLAFYVQLGGIVTMLVPALQGTSNANTFVASGIPSALQSTKGQAITSVFGARDNGAPVVAGVYPTGAFLQFATPSGIAGWTSSGSKGTSNAIMVTYLL